MKLFDDKGNCNSCHLDGRGTTSPRFQPDHSKAASTGAFVHLFRLRQPRTAPESEGCYLLSEHPGFLRIHSESRRLRLQRFGIGKFPQRRCRAQSELGLDTICTNLRRPNADIFSAQRGHGASGVSQHRGPGSLLPEGVFSQWLHQEPETTRTLLQYPRRLFRSTSLPDTARQERSKR